MRASRLLHRHYKIDQFYAGLVNEVAGPRGSGKSFLCYREVIAYLRQYKGQAVIIDTIGSLRPEVLADLIRETPPADTTAAGNANAHQTQEAMHDRVQVMRTLSVYGIVDAVREISSKFSTDDVHLSRTTREEDKIGIVVVDTIANPLGLLMQKGQQEGHAVMVSILRELSMLARMHGVCVVLVNTTVKAQPTSYQASAFSDVAIQPALGKVWPHLIDYCLFIHPIPDDSHRPIDRRGYIQEVVRSRVGGVGEWSLV